jgi:hypothetical protein
MGGGLGGQNVQNTNETQNVTGTTRQTVSIPAWLENAARQNMARADALAQIGYVPYSGPEVAALTPMQIEAMRGTNTAAGAFGLGQADPMSGMPQPQTFAGGVQGYSSMPMYDEALARLAQERPGQYAALTAPFIDPVTGAAPQSPFGSMPSGLSDGSDRDRSSGGSAFGGGAGGSSSFGGIPRLDLTLAPDAPLRAFLTDPTAGYTHQGSDYSLAELAQRAPMNSSFGGTTSLNTPMSYAPGGVNTRNPGGFINEAIAGLSGPQGAPTASDRPQTRSGSSGQGGGK